MEASVGLARCPGTCGEWVQGAQDGIPFLVDCPIDRYSEVRVKLSASESSWNIPPTKEKVSRVLNLIQTERKFTLAGEMTFCSELPVGKGMASSTADIVAASAATLLALGEVPNAQELAKLALTIEPSDSVMFPGITRLNHVHGTYFETLGPAVPAQFLALDWGGSVDTLLFNSRQDLAPHYRRYESEIRQALELVSEGVHSADLEKLAQGGTISARCNLDINPKPYFSQFHAWVVKNGGLGVITAHSGTLLAAVFPPDQHLDNLLLEAKERFNPAFIECLQARNGGVEWPG